MPVPLCTVPTVSSLCWMAKQLPYGSSWWSRKGWQHAGQATLYLHTLQVPFLHNSTTFLLPKYNVGSPLHCQREELVFFTKDRPHPPEHLLACLIMGASTETWSLPISELSSLPIPGCSFLAQRMKLTAVSVKEVGLLPFSALMPLEEAVFQT